MGKAVLTEDQIIIRETIDWLNTSSWTIDRFASDLLLPALMAAGIEEPKQELNDFDSYARWKNAKGQQIGRILRNAQPFPLAWKWVWLECLPSERQNKARKELFALAGALDINLAQMFRSPSEIVPVQCSCYQKENPKIYHSPQCRHHVTTTETRAELQRLLKETSEVVANSSPAHDGVYSAADNPQDVRRYMASLENLLEAAAREIIAVEAGTGCSPTRVRPVGSGFSV